MWVGGVGVLPTLAASKASQNLGEALATRLCTSSMTMTALSKTFVAPISYPKCAIGCRASPLDSFAENEPPAVVRFIARKGPFKSNAGLAMTKAGQSQLWNATIPLRGPECHLVWKSTIKTSARCLHHPLLQQQRRFACKFCIFF